LIRGIPILELEWESELQFQKKITRMRMGIGIEEF
jgi:hypothetical protein